MIVISPLYSHLNPNQLTIVARCDKMFKDVIGIRNHNIHQHTTYTTPRDFIAGAPCCTAPPKVKESMASPRVAQAVALQTQREERGTGPRGERWNATENGGFQSHGGTPIPGWFSTGKANLKWMRTRGKPPFKSPNGLFTDDSP